jgi:hypothetical protein
LQNKKTTVASHAFAVFYDFTAPLAFSITLTRLAVGLEQWNVLHYKNAAPRKLVPPCCLNFSNFSKKENIRFSLAKIKLENTKSSA